MLSTIPLSGCRHPRSPLIRSLVFYTDRHRRLYLSSDQLNQYLEYYRWVDFGEIRIREIGRPERTITPQPNNNDCHTQVVFADGETESVFSLSVVHDPDEPDEGCEVVVVGVTAVTGTGASVVTDGGIHDVSTEAVVRLEEDDFTSAVRSTVDPDSVDVGGGGLSPATAEV